MKGRKARTVGLTKTMWLFLGIIFPVISLFSDPANELTVFELLEQAERLRGQTVCVEGIFVQRLENSSPGRQLLFFRGDRGGVVLVNAPGIEVYPFNVKTRLTGVVNLDSRNGEISLVLPELQVMYKSSAQAEETQLGRQVITELSGSGSYQSIISQFLADSGTLSQLLLNQLGSGIIRILHPASAHESTQILSRSGPHVRFRTDYKGLMKQHSLVWQVVLSESTLIADFSFISDTSRIPSAMAANLIKDQLVEIFKNVLQR